MRGALLMCVRGLRSVYNAQHWRKVAKNAQSGNSRSIGNGIMICKLTSTVYNRRNSVVLRINHHRIRVP